MTFDAAVARLEDGLRAALPGAQAQAHLAPVPPRSWPAGFNPARVRNAAGLLLVFPKRQEKTAEIAENAEESLLCGPQRSQRFFLSSDRAPRRMPVIA